MCHHTYPCKGKEGDLIQTHQGGNLTMEAEVGMAVLKKVNIYPLLGIYPNGLKSLS